MHISLDNKPYLIKRVDDFDDLLSGEAYFTEECL